MNLINLIKMEKEKRKKYGKRKPLIITTWFSDTKRNRRLEIEMAYQVTFRRYKRIKRRIKKNMKKVEESIEFSIPKQIQNERIIGKIKENEKSPYEYQLKEMYIKQYKEELEERIKRIEKDQLELCTEIKNSLERLSYLNRKRMPKKKQFYLWKIPTIKQEEVVNKEENDKKSDIETKNIINKQRVYLIEDKQAKQKKDSAQEWLESIQYKNKTKEKMEQIMEEYYSKNLEKLMKIKECKKLLSAIFTTSLMGHRRLEELYGIPDYEEKKKFLIDTYELDKKYWNEMYNGKQYDIEMSKEEKSYKDVQIDSFQLALRQMIRTKYNRDEYEQKMAMAEKKFNQKIYNLEEEYDIAEFLQKRRDLYLDTKTNLEKIRQKYEIEIFEQAWTELEAENILSKEEECVSEKTYTYKK